MKLRSHSGMKKKVKIRKSGAVSMRKSCKNHLLINKSKRQKKSFLSGMPVDKTKMRSLRRLMPGKVVLRRMGVEKSNMGRNSSGSKDDTRADVAVKANAENIIQKK